MAEIQGNSTPTSNGRRSSERNKGKRILYNEKEFISKIMQTDRKKYRTNAAGNGGGRKVKAAATVAEKSREEMEMIRGESEGKGEELMKLGFRIEEIEGDCGVERSDHFKVKETVRIFNKFYLHLIQEEDERRKAFEAEKKQDEQKATPHKRPDLKAVTKMMEMGRILYPKRLGALPGVDVGHQFFSRAEMCAVGLHSHWINGIDFMNASFRKGEYSNYTFPLAVGIVLSGQYEDDLDNSEDIIYTGQGGNNLKGNKKQVEDQKMERGNLALKNSMEQGLPVRVVRGHSCKSSYVGRVYTYDGLYKVVNYWADKGVSGYRVFKYRLKRMAGQPELTTSQVQFAGGRIPDSISEVRGLVCEDISEGQEDIPIPATNLVDDPPVPPTGFKYLNSTEAVGSVKIPAATQGCDCNGICIDPKICACARLNGSDFPYVQKDGGRLVEAKAVVFECGPKCACGSSCINRTSQKGLRYRFEVFRTPKKGWGVRSWDYIPSGAPICEYTGVLKRSDEADSVLENNYIFDIDCLQTMKGLDGRQMRLRDVSIPDNLLDKPEEKVVDSLAEFCVDAGVKGNLARFINHSCEPNLFIQCVLSSHHDVKLARVMLFAADSIPPMQELTYDYGYALDSVMGPDGKVKQMACYCGADGCRKRLF